MICCHAVKVLTCVLDGNLRFCHVGQDIFVRCAYFCFVKHRSCCTSGSGVFRSDI
jgi:hypothetical protein